MLNGIKNMSKTIKILTRGGMETCDKGATACALESGDLACVSCGHDADQLIPREAEYRLTEVVAVCWDCYRDHHVDTVVWPEIDPDFYTGFDDWGPRAF